LYLTTIPTTATTILYILSSIPTITMTYRNKFALATAVLHLTNVVVAATDAPTTAAPTKKPTTAPTSAPTAYAGSGEWYADTANGNLCSKDCAVGTGADCSGINHDTATWQETFADATTCCTQKFSYLDNSYCVDRSLSTPAGTNKYYADTTTKSCLVDDDPSNGPFHAGTLFADAATCCAGALGWVNKDYCETRSTNGAGYTDMWYVDYQDMVCKKDCAANGAECEPTTDASASNTLFADAAACCTGKLGWIPAATCEAVSEGGTAADVSTDKYYADYSSSPPRCAKDCTDAEKTGGNPECGEGLSNVAGVQLFDDQAICCAAKFSWMDKDRCESLTTKTPTSKWYVDYQSNSCKQDCPVAANSPCGGSPPDLSMQLFEDADTCCAQKLGWVQKDTCTSVSESGAAAAPTLKWYASYDDGTCKKDCDGGSECGGILSNTAGVQLFENQDDCCAAKFGWIDEDLCVAMGTGGYTGKFYVDYADNACKQDCPTGTANCGGNPSDKSIQMFEDADTCCANKLSYLNKATCVAKSNGVASAAVGSGKWYVDWSISKCVKDCADSADTECGGLAENWENADYSDWGACCAARLNWVKDEDCHT
jgi:hypothetical protein